MHILWVASTMKVLYVYKVHIGVIHDFIQLKWFPNFLFPEKKMPITNELSITCIFKYIWFTVNITHFFTNCFNYNFQVFLWSAIRLFHLVMCCGYKKTLWMKAFPLRRPSFLYERRCFQKTMSHALWSKVIAQLKMFTSLNVNPVIMYMIAIN